MNIKAEFVNTSNYEVEAMTTHETARVLEQVRKLTVFPMRLYAGLDDHVGTERILVLRDDVEALLAALSVVAPQQEPKMDQFGCLCSPDPARSRQE